MFKYDSGSGVFAFYPDDLMPTFTLGSKISIGQNGQ